MIGKVEIFNAGGWPGERSLKSFIVLYRYKTRPMHRKGKWKQAEKLFVAHDRMEALRLAKTYGEENFGQRQWCVDVCCETSLKLA